MNMFEFENASTMCAPAIVSTLVLSGAEFKGGGARAHTQV
jgi:hypothetical protein